MKKLIMFLLVHVSPNAIFSQSVDTTQPLRQFDTSKWGAATSASWRLPVRIPDTVRALILATMCRKCAAEPMSGYVVLERYKLPVYLDCRKRALKWPQAGWGYEIVNANEQKK